MSRKKIIESDYNEMTGTSYVKISTKYGVFEGYSNLHKEDFDIASNFLGCNYAHIKAMIKYEKAKLKELKQEYHQLFILNNELEKINGYNKNELSARFFRKKMYIAKEKVEQQEWKIDKIQKNLYSLIKNYRKDREDFEKKVQKIREKREKDNA